MSKLSLLRNRPWHKATLGILGWACALSVYAEDIDIFSPAGAGSAGAPNIVFLLDNSANWSNMAQKWPDPSNPKKDIAQGEAELLAIKNVLNSMDATIPLNVGVAMYGQSGSVYSGYLRFGARSMTDSTNKTALTAILDGILADINDPKEKVAKNDGEAVALYEIYKYYNNATPYLGDSDPNRDIAAGDSKRHSPLTTVDQGLTSGWAISSGRYSSPVGTNSCGRSYVVLVANNAMGTYPAGAQTYEDKSAGTSIAGTTKSWTDEWARFLYQNGIGVYVLDAYKAQQNAEYSSVLQSAATNGGGKYFQVGSQADIEAALKQILVEIQSVNSSFASASLPLSASNRAQNLNQVFIGMFRPDADSKPRWMGNLKRYQLINSGTSVDLGDVLGQSAINLQTGFVAECAASYWTSDSASYWEDVRVNPVASSNCTTFPTVGGIVGSKWSDLPDGPRVEKGGVAEVVRKGNNPSATTTTPTWAINRTIKTHSAGSTSLVDLSTTSTSLSSNLVDWVKGQDNATTLEKVSNTTSKPRPSIHGDVIHSSPLPVNYGGSTGVVVYYGANDGMFRAVNADTGKEMWAFVAPEFHSKFSRLQSQSPLINFVNIPSGITPTPTAKDYGFDGSIGLYQNTDNTNVWIYPTMRRGGRMLYAFDVADPAAPTIKWRKGCPNLTNDTGCDTGFSAIGQTWSVPNVAFLKGYSGYTTSTPVVVVGGGYDSCEDANSTSPSCSSRKGNVVYVLNAHTGAIIRSFTVSGMGSVAADIALADTNNDGSVDYAYAADTAGGIYRIDFSDSVSLAPQAEANWAMRKVAHTSGSDRKFLFTPALLNTDRKMYVALGSGDREHPLASQYPYTTPVTNRFYVYVDDLTAAASGSTASVNLDTDSAMKDYTDPANSTCSTTGAAPSATLKGWYMDLNAGTGEQTITSALIVGGMITFNTNRPTPPSTASCTNPLGEARGYWVNLLNASGGVNVGVKSCGGLRSTTFIGGGLTASPTLATVNIGGKVSTVVVGAVQRTGGASSPIAPQKITPSITSKRKIVYWKSNAGKD